MNEILQNLIAALREELQQYGEMLALLDQQQHFVATNAPDRLWETVSLINDQVFILQKARQQRELRQSQLAGALQKGEKATFAEMLPLLADEYRLLIGALVDENNALLRQVQRRARQNQLLLNRSVELMQGVMENLLQAGSVTVYRDDGSVTEVAPGNSRLVNLIG